jgi:hypothetical protein
MDQVLALGWVFGFLAAIFFVFKPKPQWPVVRTRKRAACLAAAIFLGLPVVAASLRGREPSPDTAANSVSAGKEKPSAPVPAVQVKAPEPVRSKWRYSQDTDKMRGTVTAYASLESETELHFGFPYGSNKAMLIVRRRPSDGLNVMLQVKGQFLCSRFHDETVAAKFDDSKIENYSCSEPSDATTGLIFISGAPRFLSRLRHAKALILEAPFFQEGRQQVEFDVRGLEWK